ncbi:MAG: hypothetical protein HN368_21010 [Spirochaetales bacterium]|nr:hypothetical protein [Spirochaetales bacterium]
MAYSVGIDLGTTNLKVAFVDRSGRIKGLAKKEIEYDQQDLGEGRNLCEFSADYFTESLRSAIETARIACGASISDIEGISYSSQANTFLLLNASKIPLTPIISWQDTRAADFGDEIGGLSGHPDYLRISGMGISSTGLTAAKLLWFQKHKPDLWKQTRHVMSISDYLCFLLTGKSVGDSGTASLSGLQNIQEGTWWPEALKIIGITEAMLPVLHRPGAVLGRISREGANILGLPEGIPVAAGSLDHHAAGVGCGAGSITEGSESTGTVIACLRISPAYQPETGCCIGPDTDDGRYFRLTISNMGGSVLKEYRNQHAKDITYSDLDRLASGIEPGSAGLLGEYIAGAVSGTDFTDCGLHARAIMESVAARMGGLIDSLFPEGRPSQLSSTGGGGTSEVWSRIKADLLGIEMRRIRAEEPATLGAAFFAAAAAGWFLLEKGIPAEWVETAGIDVPNQQQNKKYIKLLKDIYKK